MKGGIGSASAVLPNGHILGALVAVNALGDIFDETTGRIVAGARSPNGHGWLAEDLAGTSFGTGSVSQSGTNTTLAVIATNAPWSKSDLAKLAQMAQTGLARAIRPVHTPMDGDIVFALSTAQEMAHEMPPGGWPFALAIAGAIAAQTLARAVVKAIYAATSLYSVPALHDLSANTK